MSDKSLLYALGGLILGVLVGVLIGRGAGDDGIRKMQGRMAAVNQSIDAQGGALAALGERLDAMEAGMADRAGAAGDAVATRLADLEGRLTGLIEDSAAQSRAAIDGAARATSEGFAALKESMAAEAPATTPASEGAPVAAEAPTASSSTPAADDMPETGLKPGESAIFEGGDLRVFVSQVTDSGARLSINGDLQGVEVGRTVDVSVGDGSCRVGLDSVDGGRAVVAATCGAESEAGTGAEGSSPEDGATTEASGEATGSGIAPGEVARLSDDLRVFLSGTSDSAARIAVNGTRVQSVGVGETIDVETPNGPCTVTLDSLEAGRASVSGTCD